MKKYVVFAGVNGSGKTTLYKTNSHIQNMLRVNIDEIVREFGTWRNADDVARAGRIAVKLIKKIF
jgi:predicted ABC-type ATPase